MRHVLRESKPEMPLVTISAAVRTDEQRVVEKRLYEIFSPRPVK
jgi:hypothetical protein